MEQKIFSRSKKLGLQNDLHNPCLFTWRHNGKLALILLYVDDILIASNDSEKLKQIKTHLCGAFKMIDLGEPKNFLGMTIERKKKERSILIHQASYAENVIERYLNKKCAQKDTHMVTRQVKNKNKRLKENAENSNKDKEFEKHPYREAIGS